MNLKLDKNKLDELVEAISLTHFHVISSIPKNEAIGFKKILESRKELKDYEFAYDKPLEEFNNLTATRIYGGKKNA